MKITLITILASLLFGCASDSKNNEILVPDCPTPVRISGPISGTLTRCQAVYHVIGTLVVEPNTTLQIEPGVRLLFVDGAGLEVRGRLLAVGEDGNKIEFDAFETSWSGIFFDNSPDESQMRFCRIEDIEIAAASQLSGAVQVSNTTVTFRNCEFFENRSDLGGAIYAIRDSLTVQNCIFIDNQAVTSGGAVLAVQSSAVLINNTFFRNNSINHGGGLVLNQPRSSNIQNNIFFRNSSTAADPRITVSGDSGAYLQQFNFLSSGNMDPLFVTPDEVRLDQFSPAIDAGNPATEFNDADGTRNDQGAFGGPDGDWTQ